MRKPYRKNHVLLVSPTDAAVLYLSQFMVVTLNGISKIYGTKPALDDVHLGVDQGDIVSIIGPSGAGKTTLLKIIAGIEHPDGGAVLYDSPPSKSNPVILVFQDYILFPNLTVFENVAFGLRARKIRGSELRGRVCAFLETFGIPDKAESYPNQLSAGQKQRVAIARAMVVGPSILLLDEPFANLDKGLKMETAEFIRTTQKRFGITTLAVTHDLEEAFAMSDKIGIMLQGKLTQFDRVEEIYFNPASYQVARFLGPVNTIPRRLFGRIRVEEPIPPGVDTVFARAEALLIEPDEAGPGVVTDVCFIGLMILYRVRIAEVDLSVYSLMNSVRKGDRVRVTLCKFFRDRGGEG